MTWAWMCGYKNGNEWSGREAVVIDGVKWLGCFFSPFPTRLTFNSNLRQRRPQRQWSVALFDTAMQETVKQYDLGTGVNPTKHKECIEAQTVAKYKVYDAIALLNSITVYIKHAPRGWCECRRPALCFGLAHSSSGHFHRKNVVGKGSITSQFAWLLV